MAAPAPTAELTVSQPAGPAIQSRQENETSHSRERPHCCVKTREVLESAKFSFTLGKSSTGSVKGRDAILDAYNTNYVLASCYTTFL